MTSIEWLKEKIKDNIGNTWSSSPYRAGYKQALIDVENMILEMAQLPQQEISDNSPKEENKTSYGEISDEEIEEEISKRYMHPTQDYAFRDACKWYREQLKQRQ
jgi:hypothetical protein